MLGGCHENVSVQGAWVPEDKAAEVSRFDPEGL